MRTRLLSAWLLSSLFFANCDRRNEPVPDETADLVAVRYFITYCSDKWGNSNSSQQYLTTASAYLAQQGITFSQAQLTQYNGVIPACAMCTCATGMLLEGRVPSSQLAAIQALGFTKK
jgi:hypothetical protein